LGFRDILISNGHGANIVAMQQIVDELSGQVEAKLVEVTYPTVVSAFYADFLVDDQPNIMHPCKGETAMIMVCAPDLADDNRHERTGFLE
jgi:creatinine amidohydrolase